MVYEPIRRLHKHSATAMQVGQSAASWVYEEIWVSALANSVNCSRFNPCLIILKVINFSQFASFKLLTEIAFLTEIAQL